jgi:hypothetical protein
MTRTIVFLAAGVAACASNAPPAPAVGEPAAVAPADANANLSPAGLLRTWIAVVEAGDWQRFVDLVHPSVRESARGALPAMTAARQAWLRGLAQELARELMTTSPAWIAIPAGEGLPAHLEWTFCDVVPPAKPRETCSFAVSEDAGRWYFLGARRRR